MGLQASASDQAIGTHHFEAIDKWIVLGVILKHRDHAYGCPWRGSTKSLDIEIRVVEHKVTILSPVSQALRLGHVKHRSRPSLEGNLL